jgi:hypothetical protein
MSTKGKLKHFTMGSMKLKIQFRKNELLYTLITRNDNVALYVIGGHYTDQIIHYEVDKIYIRNDNFGIRE